MKRQKSIVGDIQNNNYIIYIIIEKFDINI